MGGFRVHDKPSDRTVEFIRDVFLQSRELDRRSSAP